MLTSLALKGRIITLIGLLAVIVAGIWTVSRFQVELLPDVDFPLVTVVTFYPQADPQTVLRDVTEPIENAVSGLTDLSTVRSVSSPNLSIVLAEFEFGADIPKAERAITQNLESITLPPGVQPSRVIRVNPDQFPILQLSALGNRDPTDLQQIVTTDVLPTLLDLPGVFNAEIPVDAGAEGTISRTNGLPSLAIAITKDPEANTVEVANSVLQKLDDLKSGLPSDIEFIVIANQAPDIQNSIDKLTREVMLGAVLAVLVIFAFLLSVRPTFITGISIPASLLGGLIIMGFQDMSLNIMTLGGLAIAAGRVVDDSIVVMENIYRHIQRGEDRIQASLDGAKEVALPITASTLTTIAVFAPLGFMGGIIGTFFLPFALTIIYALLASLLVALTVVPVLGSLLIKRRESEGMEGRVSEWLKDFYTPGLRFALGHKVLAIVASLVIFIGSLSLLPFIPQSFLPGFSQKVLTVEMSVPPGSPPSVIASALDDVESVLESLRGDGPVDAYQSQVGGSSTEFGPGGGLGSGSTSTANILVRLTEDADVDVVAAQLREDLVAEGRTLFISEAAGGGPQGNSLELILLGEDYGATASTAQEITAILQEHEGLINVRSDAIITTGIPGLEASLPITRINGSRAVTISGTITAANTRVVNQDVSQVVEEVGLPPGVELDTGGVFADIQEAFAQMGIAMLIGISLVYLVMVVSQRSLLTPLIIVFSIPLASIGALGGLFITQRTLGLPALMGVLMLIGLVVTNAIVLIAFVDQLRRQGSSVREALIEGGRTRLRPILMTAMTTSFVLVPLALESDASSGIIGAELATVIIGGLMTSTFLTLVVVPVIYSLLRRDPKQPPDAETELVSASATE